MVNEALPRNFGGHPFLLGAFMALPQFPFLLCDFCRICGLMNNMGQPGAAWRARPPAFEQGNAKRSKTQRGCRFDMAPERYSGAFALPDLELPWLQNRSAGLQPGLTGREPPANMHVPWPHLIRKGSTPHPGVRAEEVAAFSGGSVAYATVA